MGVPMGARMDSHMDVHMDVHKDVRFEIHMDVHMDAHMDAHRNAHIGLNQTTKRPRTTYRDKVEPPGDIELHTQITEKKKEYAH